jgi:predicted amino acid dehydrogenase
MLFGLRTAQPRLALGLSDGRDLDEVAPICRLGTPEISGVVLGIPWLPEQLLTDQPGALRAMERAVQLAAPVAMVGLGSVLSAVAGRGGPLAQACGIPVTTGNAATAWCAAAVAARVADGRVAVLGGGGTVGRALVELLDGVPDPQDLRAFRTVVGAHTTGGVLDPARLAPGTTLIDVALPPTLAGPTPPGVRVLAGESVALPPSWRRDGWGWVFHVVAGYGLRSVYACLLEPLVALASGRERPWAQGRRLVAEDVVAFGAAAAALGFEPELRSRGH